MNPTLLKDLILAGHRVACKTIEPQWKVFEPQWKVFLRTDWQWNFQWQLHWISVEDSINKHLSSSLRTDWAIRTKLTWEYKIVTPLPQLPQVWDTVEVLEICRELPWFNKWLSDRKDMVWKKHTVDRIDESWDIYLWDFWFTSRQVSKCEPEKAQSIQSEEQFWDTIVFNWRTYKAI